MTTLSAMTAGRVGAGSSPSNKSTSSSADVVVVDVAVGLDADVAVLFIRRVYVSVISGRRCVTKLSVMTAGRVGAGSSPSNKSTSSSADVVVVVAVGLDVSIEREEESVLVACASTEFDTVLKWLGKFKDDTSAGSTSSIA